MIERHLRLKEAAEMLGISTQTLRAWDKAGKIKVTRTVGNQRRVPQSEINRLMGYETKSIFNCDIPIGSFVEMINEEDD